MNNILIIDENALISRINYLTSIDCLGVQNREEVKNEAIACLNWVYITSIRGINGLYVEYSKLSKEIAWLANQMEINDKHKNWLMSSKYSAREEQLFWVINSISEKTHPKEITKDEKLHKIFKETQWELTKGPNPVWVRKNQN